MEARPSLRHRTAQLPGRQRRELSCLPGRGLRYFGPHAAEHDGVLWRVGVPNPDPDPNPGKSDTNADNNPTPTPTATPTATATVPPTPTPTPTPATPTPTPSSTPAHAVNFSTRMRVDVGDSVGIGGFIITGSAPKHVLIRAIGPSLTHFGIDPLLVLADPVLELHGPGAFTTVINNNWRDTQEAAIQATGIPPTNDLESAIVATLAPGAYTAIVKGNGNTQLGVALVEVYDLDQSAGKLANISTRAFVGTGDNVVIAGFILGNGDGDDQIIVRGMGPSLSAFGLPAASVLANPTLELRDANGALLFSNNDWQDNAAQAAIVAAAGLAPSNNLESAIAATLPPGLYTALLAGLNNSTGLGLVEVYDRGDGSALPTPSPSPTPTPGTPSPTPTPGTPTPTATATATVAPSPTATATATVAPSPTATPGGVPFAENFDVGVTPPAVPAGWLATIVTGPPPQWATTTTSPDSPPNDAFVGDAAVISDKVLDTLPITITSAAAVLTFRNNFDTEFSGGTFWDGGVLEVSSPNINWGVFTDVTDAAVGGSFVTGGYTGQIDPTANNPLADRLAWSGSSGGYITTVVNLGPTVNGQTIKLRFRMGTDEAVGAPGWRIDTLSMVGGTVP